MDNTTTQQIINFISDNYGYITGLGISIYGVIKTKIFPLIKEFITVKNSLIKDEKTRTLVESAEQKVKDLLEITMSAIEKTTKEEIVNKIANGELTKDSLSTLPSTVINKVKNQLSNSYKETLKSEYGDVEDYLATKAQYLYDKYKNDETSVIGTVKVSDVANVVTNVIGTTDVASKTTELLDKLKDVAEQKVADNNIVSTENIITTETIVEDNVQASEEVKVAENVDSNASGVTTQAEVINSSSVPSIDEVVEQKSTTETTTVDVDALQKELAETKAKLEALQSTSTNNSVTV